MCQRLDRAEFPKETERPSRMSVLELETCYSVQIRICASRESFASRIETGTVPLEIVDRDAAGFEGEIAAGSADVAEPSRGHEPQQPERQVDVDETAFVRVAYQHAHCLQLGFRRRLRRRDAPSPCGRRTRRSSRSTAAGR